MFYKKSRSIEELESVSIDNIFLNKYLPQANGTYVKVYLLGYQKSLQSRDLSEDQPVISHQSLGELLGIPLSDVLDAWKYWESQGIIRTHPLNPSSKYQERENFAVEFLDLKEKFLLEHHYGKLSTEQEVASTDKVFQQASQGQETFPQPSEEGALESHKNPYHCQPEDLIEANKNPQIRNMFVAINKIIQRPLIPNEKIEILGWFYNYNIEPPLIVEAYRLAKEKKNVSTVQYVEGIIRNWYDQGITSEAQLQNHRESQKDRFSLYNRIFRALGFSTREPSEKEREIMDHWFDEFQFPMEIILRACDESIKIASPNISYIHGVLKNWHKNKVASLEDVEALRQAAKQKKASKPSPQKSSGEPFKTKFHLSDSRTSKYNAEELEALIMKRQNRE